MAWISQITSIYSPYHRRHRWSKHKGLLATLTENCVSKQNPFLQKPCLQQVHIILIFSSVQFSCSVVSDSLQPHESQHTRPPCPSPTPGVHPNPFPLNQWCHTTISSCRPLLILPPIPPSSRVFSNESGLRVRWPKYWICTFKISPSNEDPGLISFRMDWLDLLAAQGTQESSPTP